MTRRAKFVAMFVAMQALEMGAAAVAGQTGAEAAHNVEAAPTVCYPNLSATVTVLAVRP